MGSFSERRHEVTESFAQCFWYCTEDEFRSLVRAGADVNVALKGYEGGRWHTPLHTLATRKEKREITKAEFLLANGARVNALDSEGRSALAYMVRVGSDNPRMATLLIEHGARLDFHENGAGPLHLAAQRNLHQLAGVLISAGLDPRSGAPLRSPFLPRSPAVLQPGDGMEMRATNRAEPIHFAAVHAHCEVARTLLDHGAAADAATSDGDTARQILEARLKYYLRDVAEGTGRLNDWATPIATFQSLLAQPR